MNGSREGESSRPPDAGRAPAKDLLGERLVPLKQVPKLGLIPDRWRGSRLNVRTVYRWATCGLRGVRLETLLIGGQRVTSEEALTRFFRTVSAAAGPISATARPPEVRVEEGGDVDAELDDLGF